MKVRLLLAVILVVSAFSASSVTYAEDDEPDFPTDDEVNLIAKKLYCPVCPNTPLDVCETQACQDWRAQIKDQLKSGWTEDQIIDYFVVQYGERVLAEPQRRGFSAMVWVLPLIAVGLGLIALWYVLRGWRANRSPPEEYVINEVDLEPEVIARIEDELNRMR
ncbi:MAG: cytochrome c-type biogenesis protein [Anaerolineales bacterium]